MAQKQSNQGADRPRRRRRRRGTEFNDRNWDGPAVAKLAFFTVLPIVPLLLLLLAAMFAG